MGVWNKVVMGKLAWWKEFKSAGFSISGRPCSTTCSFTLWHKSRNSPIKNILGPFAYWRVKMGLFYKLIKTKWFTNILEDFFFTTQCLYKFWYPSTPPPPSRPLSHSTQPTGQDWQWVEGGGPLLPHSASVALGLDRPMGDTLTPRPPFSHAPPP